MKRKEIIKVLDKYYIKGLINKTVKDGSLFVVNKIPDNLLSYLNFEDICSTDYGTIIIDWESEDDSTFLSLEIGENEIGYFSEINGTHFEQENSIKMTVTAIMASKLLSSLEEVVKHL